jgi:hypothetical protein
MLMASVDQLLQALNSMGVAQPRELAERLGISAPTLARLVMAAGNRVCRMGRTRATRYARTRSLPGLGSQLPIYCVSEAGRIEERGTMCLLASGGHWLEEPEESVLFVGLPPFASDMSPQGYLGRTFTARFPEIELPPHLRDWNDDHRLLALARRGEDCVGNVVIGKESLNRLLESTPEPIERACYPELARRSAQGQPGSSAGGDQPKFLAYSEGRYVLVKFVENTDGPAARRWSDLLMAECLALEAIRAAGIDAASAHCFDEGGFRFLEIERFDRVGMRGRRGLISLAALDDEYIGHRGSWTQAVPRLLERLMVGSEDARRMRWLDVFGQLTANSDRHFGNLSFYELGTLQLRLAPAYDMLPMLFAPVGATIIDRTFTPPPPTADTLDVWPDAARNAREYWTRLIDSEGLSSEFRALSRRCRDALDQLLSRVSL